jgi:protein-S-isoprenylcysteine O-methyltransferase Ste14
MDGEAIRWLGVALFAGGGALQIWPVFVLGHRFSGLVAIQRGHTLVTDGIFGVVRHPSYLGNADPDRWLVIPPLVARIRAEEGLLRTQFGDEYEVYLSPHVAADPPTLLKRHQWRLACLRSRFSSTACAGEL